MKNNLFIISKNGWQPIATFFGLFLFFMLFDFDFFATVSLFVMIFLLFVYRNPERTVASYSEGTILSPVDGVVKRIESLEDSDFGYKIEIESSYKDVALLRAPISATLSDVSLVHGSRVTKFSPLFEKLNESAEILFETKDAKRVKVVHRLKQSISPVELGVNEGEEILCASRYGYMLNGLTTIYLESDTRLNIQVGQEIKAVQTLLAYSS